MKKEYKALGGMFEFTIATGPDYDEMSEENLKDKTGTNNEDIPYEVRMKHIIEAYRKDQEKGVNLLNMLNILKVRLLD